MMFSGWSQSFKFPSAFRHCSLGDTKTIRLLNTCYNASEDPAVKALSHKMSLSHKTITNLNPKPNPNPNRYYFTTS